MFDWNEDRVGDTIWGEFDESEDHIVPYPRDGEENALLNYGNYGKKQKNGECITGIRSKLISGEENDPRSFNVESSSVCNMKEELSPTRLDVDAWPDFPSLNAALSQGYNDEIDQDSLQTGLLSDFPEEHDLNKVEVQLDGEHEFFGNEHEDREGDSFLDCDWANIEAFDDLDKLVRNNDSIFGHDIGSSADEFLSPFADAFNGTPKSIPMPDIPASQEQSANQECFPHNFSTCSDGMRKPDEKTADIIVKTEEQTACQANTSGIQNQPSDKFAKQQKTLKARKKAEERSRNNFSQSLNGSWSSNLSQGQQLLNPEMCTSPASSMQAFHYSAINQQGGVGNRLAYLSSSNQLMFPGYGYPVYSFPSAPVLPHTTTERNKKTPVLVGHKPNPVLSKPLNDFARPQDISKSTMTPKEKIEKLRRRQQMQAMLAIQQQKQQFGSDTLISQACPPKNQNQNGSSSVSVAEESANKVPSSEVNMSFEQDSMSTDDQSLEETIYHQLQDALSKLDVRVRLCIRDSLFRLAKSAMERQSACDGSRPNKSNKDDDEVLENIEANYQERSTKLADAETTTNPIDRTVAYLLFYQPSDLTTKTVKEKPPCSPAVCKPA